MQSNSSRLKGKTERMTGHWSINLTRSRLWSYRPSFSRSDFVMTMPWMPEAFAAMHSKHAAIEMRSTVDGALSYLEEQGHY